MDNIKTILIKHVHSCDNPRDECEKIMIYAMTLRQTIVDNNKKKTPPDPVPPFSVLDYPYPVLGRLFNKKDPLDKQILQLTNEGVLSVSVVKLKGVK